MGWSQVSVDVRTADIIHSEYCTFFSSSLLVKDAVSELSDRTSHERELN